MKTIVELKQERAAKIERMNAISAGAETAKRELNPEETSEFDTLERDCQTLDSEIERSEAFAKRLLQVASNTNPKQTEMQREEKRYDISKAIREAVSGKLSGRELEFHEELSRTLKTTGILIPKNYRANENTVSTHASILDVRVDPSLSIIGKKPLHELMGVTMMRGLQGQLKLNYQAPLVAANTAVGTDIANSATNPTAVTLIPERFGITDSWDMDLIHSQNAGVHSAILGDMERACERAITAKVYTVALAGATEVGSTALTVAGLNLLMAALDVDGNIGFAMDPGSFYTGKAVLVDTGSGIRMFTFKENNIGLTYEGVPVYYSSLFDDTAAKQFVIYGDWSKVVVGEWGALEMIVDPYAAKKAARVEITLNKIADAVVRDANALVKSIDLDSGT